MEALDLKLSASCTLLRYLYQAQAESDLWRVKLNNYSLRWLKLKTFVNVEMEVALPENESQIILVPQNHHASTNHQARR